MATKPKPSMTTVGELFCGAGGMGRGLRDAGFLTAWGVEIDSDACDSYEANVGLAIRSRVEDVQFNSLPSVDGLAFGFPCNDFSLVGERKGTAGYFGGLYVHAVRALDECQPSWFMAENVPGIMSAGGENIMRRFATASRSYSVAIHLYRFDEYGVPQKRSRIVAVGIAKDIGRVFRPPAPTHTGKPITSEQALRNIHKNAANHEQTHHPARTIHMLRTIPEGANAWHPNVPESLRIQTDVKMSLIYRRLHRDEPAYTVVASGGGGTHMYHYEEPRALTNRERARLQTFGDDFVFSGKRGAVRKQIGMAVPPLAASVIGTALRMTLSGEDYPSVDPSYGYAE